MEDFARSSGQTCISDPIFLLKTDSHRPVRSIAIIEFVRAKRHVLYELRWIFYVKDTANKLSKDKTVLQTFGASLSETNEQSWAFRILMPFKFQLLNLDFSES